MAKLDEQTLRRRLEKIPGWELSADSICKQFQLSSFPAAMALVNWVGWRAEAADHHPDILINYRRVTFTCSTHSEGGVTEKDLALARAIEEGAVAAAT